MLKPLNRITNCSVVLGAILLTSMGARLTPAQATTLPESNSLMLHPAAFLFSSAGGNGSSSDPTTSTPTPSADPVPAPEPTYTAGVLALSVLGLGVFWKVLHQAK